MSTLLHDIDAFRKRHKLSRSAFGQLALNDKAFVFQIEGGRRVWPETEEKVRDFMATYSPDQREQAA
jgi:hypothetical protein